MENKTQIPYERVLKEMILFESSRIDIVKDGNARMMGVIEKQISVMENFSQELNDLKCIVQEMQGMTGFKRKIVKDKGCLKVVKLAKNT